MKQTALLILIAFAPGAWAHCATVQDGPISLCQPVAASQPAGDRGTSAQTPPDIPCWYQVSCAASTNPKVQLTAQAQSVAYAARSVISWTSQGASACSLSPSFGAVPVSGSRTTPALTKSTTYTVTCSGSGGSATQSVTVSVQSQPGPTITLTASPQSFRNNKVCQTEPPAGGWGGNGRCSTHWAGNKYSGTLTWSATNASSCTIYKNGSSFGSGTSGSKNYYAPTPNYPTTDNGQINTTSDTYKAVCRGPGGTSAKTVVVTTKAQYFLR